MKIVFQKQEAIATSPGQFYLNQTRKVVPGLQAQQIISSRPVPHTPASTPNLLHSVDLAN